MALPSGQSLNSVPSHVRRDTPINQCIHYQHLLPYTHGHAQQCIYQYEVYTQPHWCINYYALPGTQLTRLLMHLDSVIFAHYCIHLQSSFRMDTFICMICAIYYTCIHRTCKMHAITRLLKYTWPWRVPLNRSTTRPTLPKTWTIPADVCRSSYLQSPVRDHIDCQSPQTGGQKCPRGIVPQVNNILTFCVIDVMIRG
jgi:hypothetical protein